MSTYKKELAVLKRLAKMLYRLPIKSRLKYHEATHTWRFPLAFVNVTADVRLQDGFIQLSTVLYRVPEENHNPQDILYILDHASQDPCFDEETGEAMIKCCENLEEIILDRHMPLRLLKEEAYPEFYKYIDRFTGLYRIGRDRVIDSQSDCIKEKNLKAKRALLESAAGGKTPSNRQLGRRLSLLRGKMISIHSFRKSRNNSSSSVISYGSNKNNTNNESSQNASFPSLVGSSSSLEVPPSVANAAGTNNNVTTVTTKTRQARRRSSGGKMGAAARLAILAANMRRENGQRSPIENKVYSAKTA